VVLLNTTSHDEDNYNDPWQALLRYAACSTVDGVPMIFPGQELGISNQYGYDLLERNLGKFIPHFKTWNSMMPLWTNTDFGLDQLSPVYAAIGRARRASPALRSPNRYFLDQLAGGTHQRIFSVAKYQAENASPATGDVVFGFVNLDRDADRNGVFNVAIDRNGSNLFGIKSGRSYNIRNLAAYTAQDSVPRRRAALALVAQRQPVAGERDRRFPEESPHRHRRVDECSLRGPVPQVARRHPAAFPRAAGQLLRTR
jgi:hypothetical protein